MYDLGNEILAAVANLLLPINMATAMSCSETSLDYKRLDETLILHVWTQHQTPQWQKFAMTIGDKILTNTDLNVCIAMIRSTWSWLVAWEIIGTCFGTCVPHGMMEKK